MRTPTKAMVFASSAVIVAVSACGGGEAQNPEVAYLTGFGTFGREAHAYVALERGYFADEGLDVDIQAGSGTIPNITQVVAGDADFALADLTGLQLALGADDVEGDFTVVAAVQQQTVFSVIALEESGIAAPADLEGRTIGDAPGSFGPLLFPTYAELAGFDADSVDYDNSFDPPQLPTLLASGTVDAIGQFLVGTPTVEQAADGRSAVVLPFSDVLPDLYGIALITSTDLAEDDPELVERFVRALMRGLEDAIDDPEQAATILVEHEPEMDAAAAAAELELMAPYVRPDDGPIGAVDEQRIAQSIRTLEDAGAMPAGLRPADVVTFSLVPQG